jgi:hypothetical protein
MSNNQSTVIKELSRKDSEEYLDLFEALEYKNSYPSCDAYDNRDANFYIWLIDISNTNELPIGFIGYNIFVLSKKEEFIYIVKFYVFGAYKKYMNPDGEATLINGEKASNLLFERVKLKDKNIITLTSASESLDEYYSIEYGFEFNDEISEKFAEIIGISSGGFLFLDVQKSTRNLESEEELKSLFGQK